MMENLSNQDIVTVCSCCCSNIINTTNDNDTLSTNNSKSQDQLIVIQSISEPSELDSWNKNRDKQIEIQVQIAPNANSQIIDNEQSIKQIEFTRNDHEPVVSTSTTQEKHDVEKKNERENVSLASKDLQSSFLCKIINSHNNNGDDCGGKTIEEKLSMIFEFPYISRNEKTLFSASVDAHHPLTFCSKCDTALTELYKKYCEFITLLQSNNNNQIYPKVQKIGIKNSQSLLPVVIYNDNNFQLNDANDGWEKVESLLPEEVRRNLNSEGFIVLHDLHNNYQKVLEGERNSRTNNATDDSKDVNMNKNNNCKDKTNERRMPAKLRRKTPVRLTDRQKTLSLLKNQKDDFKNKSNKYKTSLQKQEQRNQFERAYDEGFSEQHKIPQGEDLVTMDEVSTSTTTVVVVSVDNTNPSSEIKQQESMRRRRGRKPGWKKSTQPTATNAKEPNHDVCDNNDIIVVSQSSNNEQNQPSPKRKRVRQLKKEFWYEEATKDPERQCDICGKAFLYNRMMIHHKATVHEGKRPFSCDFCGRSFTQNFILKKHTCDYRLAPCSDREFLMLSREEQLFKWQCKVCGKKFKERSSLNVHQMNHMGENFECELCQKKFRRPDHMKTHMKIVHSDEKKFTCFNCGKCFKTSSNLRAHERKHLNPDQKHLCNICGRSIKTLSQMARHQKTHDDVLPYQCPICGKRFKMKDYLGQHLRKGKTCKLPKKTNLNALVVKENPNNEQLPMSEQPQQSFLSSGSSNDNEENSQLQEAGLKKEHCITVEFDSNYSVARENITGEESGILSPTLELTYTIQTGDDGILTNL